VNIPGLDKRIHILRKRHDGYEVSFPVSYEWNGGPSVVVDPPVEPPPGWEFHSLACGLNMNARPPRQTVLMAKKEIDEPGNPGS